ILIILSIVISVVSIIGGMCYGIYWAHIRQQQSVCLDMKILIRNNPSTSYLKEPDIRDYLQKTRSNPEGKVISRINTSTIEEILNDNPYIRKADVFMGVNKILYLWIYPRKPVLRVLNRGYESYYLDEDAVIMPVNPQYAIRTRFVNGNIGVKHTNGQSVKNINGSYDRKILNDVFTLSEYIRRDTFLNAQIEQIYVTSQNEIELYPKIGRHVIIFGGIEDMENKLDKLKLVYKQGFAKMGWDLYRTINLKYKNQVVCTKI
ncbi:MAG: hypothetical protein RR190_01435, partial [Bacteroidales bacterium]